MSTVQYLVMGSSGKWELYDKWVVAGFTERAQAEEWCWRCRQYGDWITKMAVESYEEDSREASRRYSAGDVDSFFLTQWEWSLEGNEAQMNEWQQEFEQQHPDGDWFAHWQRELSLMLNPYDPFCYASCREHSIRYRVVEIAVDPQQPFGAE